VYVLAVTIGITLAAAAPARAQALFVTTTQEDTAANQLVIKGGTFADGVRVFLALVELPVVSVEPNQIVASLGSSERGSHWLIVFQPATSQIAQFWTTIGNAPPAPTQGLGTTTHYTGNGWVLESVSPNLFRLRSTTSGGPRAFGIVYPESCGATFGNMTSSFMSSNTAGDVIFGSVCNPGASLLATVWDSETAALTQIRCVRINLNANMCQRFE
jgi:hypothetical protein